jgi:nitrate/nitrite-specific signal transduction histidine kinase
MDLSSVGNLCMEGQPFSIALHDKVSARCESKIVDVITADSILEHIDGKGIDPVILSEGGLEGHLGMRGMRGMRERTKLIRGTLAVRSRLVSGTEVELSIPATYADPCLSTAR